MNRKVKKFCICKELLAAETDKIALFLTILSFKAIHIFHGFQLLWPTHMNSEAQFTNVRHSVKVK